MSLIRKNAHWFVLIRIGSAIEKNHRSHEPSAPGTKGSVEPGWQCAGNLGLIWTALFQVRCSLAHSVFASVRVSSAPDTVTLLAAHFSADSPRCDPQNRSTLVSKLWRVRCQQDSQTIRRPAEQRIQGWHWFQKDALCAE